MKKITLNLFLLISGLILAQTTNPDLLVTIQKATQAEIDAYNNAELELGMLVYNTDENRIYKYTNQGWLKLLTEIDNTSLTYIDIFNNANSDITVNNSSNGVIVPFDSIRLQNRLTGLINNQVEITEGGIYEISYTISLQKTSNAENNTLEIILCENNTALPNTGTIIAFQQANNNNGNNGNGNGNNGNGNGENLTSASRSLLVELKAGNSYGVKLRGFNFDTNDTVDVTVLGQLSGMSIKKID